MKRKIIKIDEIIRHIAVERAEGMVAEPVVEAWTLTFADGLVITVSPLDFWEDDLTLNVGDEIFVYQYRNEGEYIISRHDLSEEELKTIKKQNRVFTIVAIVFILVLAAVIVWTWA